MKVRLQPHLVSPDGAVTWGPWWGVLNGARQQLSDKLTGWDYESETVFELQPSFDIEVILGSTGMDSVDDLAIVLLLDCPSAGERWSSAYLLGDYLDSDKSALSVTAPVGNLAESVRLSAHLVLWDRRSANDGTATRPGSRLAWSEAHSLTLEGEGARFPTEEVSFKELGLEHAAWTLRTSFLDLSDTFMSNVRLLLNRDHAASNMLLEEGPPQSLVQSALRLDIARQLILHVASDPDSFQIDRSDWEEGSVGSVISELTTTHMRMGLANAVYLARTDPARFERKMQEGFDFMEVR